MREIRRFQLDAEVCIARRIVSACQLVVETGRVWLTIEGDSRDHWLAPGDCRTLARGKRIWLSADAGGAHLRVVEATARVATAALAVPPPLRWAASRSIIAAPQTLP